MASPKRAHWLDQAVMDSRPGRVPKADFGAWRSAHAEALKRLKERGAHLPCRRLLWAAILQLGKEAMQSPMAKLAVAAALIAGILLVATLYKNRTPGPSEPAVIAIEPAPPATPGESEIAERELILARELFIQSDTRGLLSLLTTARSQTTATIAAYLAQIGDISSVPTLEAFAARWQGAAQDNPFQRAVAQIRDRWPRHEPNDVQSVAVHPPQTASSPPVVSPPVPRQDDPVQTYRGLVVDRTGTPVAKTLVWAQRYTQDLRPTNLVTPVITGTDGKFTLRLRTATRGTGDALYLVGKHPAYALGWARLPAGQEADDPNRCVIVLCEPTVVSGIVMDEQGQPIPGALVEARVAVKQSPDRVYEYPYTAGSDRAVKTDREGRFVLKDVPTGSVLNLFVSRQGYASYDSRESQSQGVFASRPSFIDPAAYSVQAGQQNLPVEITSAPGLIDGRIIRENGTPFDKDVTLLCERVDTSSGIMFYGYTEGKWTLWDRLPRGRYAVTRGGRFRIEGLAWGNYRVAAADPVSGDLLTTPATANIDGQSPRAAMTLVVAGASRVTVHVLDIKTGTPVPQVLVVADNGMRTQRHTDPNGLCSFPLVPGHYTIWARGWVATTRAAVQVTPSSKDLRVEMTVEVPPPSPGRLVGELGTPVRGSICLNAGQWISTDTEGRFMIPGGTSNAVGLARDLTGTRARLFWWKDASSAGQEIHVERLAVLTARIVDGYGNPAGSATPASFYFLTPGIQAAPYYAIEPLGFRSRLVSGRFRFEVPTGLPLQVEVVAAGAGSGESELINPMPGQTYDLGDIVLGPHSSPKP